MTTKLPLRDGEHVPQVAKQAGFKTYRTVWEAQENAALRSKYRHPNPCVLAPGDVVSIPDEQPRKEAASTGQRHVFFVAGATLRLRIALQTPLGPAFARAKGGLDVDGDYLATSSGPSGIVERPIPVEAKEGNLDFGPFRHKLRIGFLNPVELESGWQARLNNLGYEVGQVGAAPPEAVRSASEEFQCDAGLSVTGVMDDATADALVAEHGC